MTTTDNQNDNNQLVDLEVLRVIYTAANARLDKVRQTERETYGVAKTDLTDVGRAALHRWKLRPAAMLDSGRRPPTVTYSPKGEGYVGKCALCPQEFEGATRAVARSKARGHSSTHTRPFRFSMERGAYNEIKEAIHRQGLSVASVVQDGLETFARTGQF